MTKKILLMISIFLVPFALLFADEGDVERLVVPEMQTASTTDEEPLEEDIIQDAEHADHENVVNHPIEESNEASTSDIQEQKEVLEDTTETQAPQIGSEQTNMPEAQEEQTPKASEEPLDTKVQEAPSTEELEAKHAEETELREVGAGEEPVE